MSSDNLYTYSEVSKILKISEVTLRRWVSQRKIPFKKIGTKAVRFSYQDLDAITHAQPVEGIGA